jgi:hypothetical protein
MSPTEKYKQFKLTSGEEIVAEVMDIDEEEGIAVLRAAMKIIELEADDGYSYFAFRPFMAFTESAEKIQVLNVGHIIGESTPSKNLMGHYASTIGKMEKFLSGGKTMEEMENMDDQTFEQYIEELETELEKDERGENVIKFKPKDTYH